MRNEKLKRPNRETCMSVRLRNRRNSPINGFQFREPKTGALLTSWGFDDLVGQVRQHRSQNPRFNLTTDKNAVETEVDEQNAMRMLAIRGAEAFITMDEVYVPKTIAPRRRSVFASVAGGVNKLAAGMSVLHDWLGEGGQAVPREQSARRAAVCANCPKNEPGDWTRFFTEEASETIRRQLAIKNDMALTTPDDEKLQVCGACLCPLKLKVHTPLMHIIKHMSAKVKGELHGECWILKEMSNP